MNKPIISSEENATQPKHILMFEYERAQQQAIHYDVMNMQFTAILTAGVFVLWGLVLRIDSSAVTIITKPTLIVFVELFIFAIDYIWLQYVTIHRRIVVRKYNRIHEIEQLLGMKNNSNFKYDYEKVTRRPGGHTTEIFLFQVLAVFGVLLAIYFQRPAGPISSLPIKIANDWGLWDYVRLTISLLPLFPMIRHSFHCKLDVARYIEGYLPPPGTHWLLLSQNRFIRKALTPIIPAWWWDYVDKIKAG